MNTSDKNNIVFWKYLLWVSFLILFLFLSACQHKKENSFAFTDTLNFKLSGTLPSQNVTTPKTDENAIYYGIYSPAKVSAIFNRKNISYDPDILSPVNHLPSFNTTAQMAISLGVYGADFSYAQLFQSADAAKYLVLVLKLSEKLGIPPEYIKDLTKRLEVNLPFPDSLMQISIEAFNHINRFLIDQDQENMAYLIIAGAWIEAMYIASQDLLKDNDPVIIKKIIEQKYSLEFLLSNMKNYYTDTNIAYFYRRMFVLDKYMKKTQVTFQKESFTIDNKTKTIISSGDKIYFSKDNIRKIKEIIFSLRKLALNE